MSETFTLNITSIAVQYKHTHVNATGASPADIISATMEDDEFLTGIKAWKCGLCQCVT